MRTKMEPHAVGVDWSSGAWLAVAYSDEDGPPDARVFDEIRGVWTEYGDAARRILVDVPIGLCESFEADSCRCVETDGTLSRRCDDLARDVVGPRSSSVFTPPAREAAKLAAKDREHAVVSERNRELTGKGLMQQAANISKGIVEVEELLLDDGDPTVLLEAHPEVCFRAFAGTPLQHSKKTAPGVDERLSALSSVAEYDDGTWRAIARDLGAVDHMVQLDDVLDALALALTALAPTKEFHRLPPEPPKDTKGLPMQMVYRRSRALPDVKG